MLHEQWQTLILPETLVIFFNLHTIIDRRFFHTKNTYIFPIYIRNIDRRFLTIQSTLLSTGYLDIITSESLCWCLEKETKHLIFPRSLKFLCVCKKWRDNLDIIVSSAAIVVVHSKKQHFCRKVTKFMSVLRSKKCLSIFAWRFQKITSVLQSKMCLSIFAGRLKKITSVLWQNKCSSIFWQQKTGEI